jgi:hypothetical protein
MQYMRALHKKLLAAVMVAILGVLTNFSFPPLSPYTPNRGHKTEARTNNPETCEQACTLNSQSSYSSSTATLSLMDGASASIPPGGFVVALSAAILFVYFYARRRQLVFVSYCAQQLHCLWRF